MVEFVNRAYMTTSTTGTGTITLGSAVTNYQTFSDAGIVDSDEVRYLIEDGTDWEIGVGVYTSSGTTLSRTVSESTNSDSAISLSGSAVVAVIAAAEDFDSDSITNSSTQTGTTVTDALDNCQPLDTVLTNTTASFTTAQETKLSNIETSATADQSDSEIETAYNNQVSVVGQAEAEAGASSTVRRWTALRVAQAIAALETDNDIPSGTLMLFQQTSAPTGWTKQTTHNDKALRVVSGTASSGGSVAFSTVFAKTATDGHSLTEAETGQHDHALSGGISTDGSHDHGVTTLNARANASNGANTTLTRANSGTGSSSNYPFALSADGSHDHSDTFSIGNAGSGSSHTHGMDIRVHYVDLIIASKD